jgi:hypothetical protein
MARIATGMPADRCAELTAALRAFADAAGEPEPRAEASTSLGW